MESTVQVITNMFFGMSKITIIIRQCLGRSNTPDLNVNYFLQALLVSTQIRLRNPSIQWKVQSKISSNRNVYEPKTKHRLVSDINRQLGLSQHSYHF